MQALVCEFLDMEFRVEELKNLGFGISVLLFIISFLAYPILGFLNIAWWCSRCSCMRYYSPCYFCEEGEPWTYDNVGAGVGSRSICDVSQSIFWILYYAMGLGLSVLF